MIHVPFIILLYSGLSSASFPPPPSPPLCTFTAIGAYEWNNADATNVVANAGDQLNATHHQIIVDSDESDMSELDTLLSLFHSWSYISCNNFPPLPSSPSSQWNLFSNDTCGGWMYGDETLWFCAECTLQKCLGICEPYPFAVYHVNENRCVCRTYCGHVFDGGAWVSYARVIEPPMSASHPPPLRYAVPSPSYPVASPPTSDTWNSRSTVIVAISVSTLVTSLVTLMTVLRFVQEENVASVPTHEDGK